MAAESGREVTVIIYSWRKLRYIPEERALQPARSAHSHPLFFEP